jgi:aryl-alcohol dehydrogenase-like predicted oxidoreductase
MEYILGTAQLNSEYGIYEKKIKASKKELQDIFRILNKKKIKRIDTAPAYKNSERTIGVFKKKNIFSIDTKVEISTSIQNIKKKLINSLKKLKINSVNIYYIHNPNILNNLKLGKKIFDELHKLKSAKKIKNIGVSTYYLKEAKFIINNYNIDAIQVPISIFDQRFLHKEFIKLVKKKNIKLIARSVFLQGIIFLKQDELEKKFNKKSSFVKTILSFQKYCKKNRINPIYCCINFIKKQKIIDGIVIGSKLPKQLINNLIFFKKRIIKTPQFFSKSKYILPTNWC